MIVISNNPSVWEENPQTVKIEGSPVDVMKEVKKRIYEGHKLLSMPISGNLRMIISPYRSVMIHSTVSEIDNHSVMLVENALERLKMTDFSSVPAFTIKDYQYMDREFLKSAAGEISCSESCASVI